MSIQKSNMLELTSNPRNVAQVEAFVQKIVHKYRIRPDLYGDILISLTEAVNNAITHGNRNDESKTVRIRCQKQKDRLTFSVSDEGKGFDPKNIPDPTKPQNILNVGGRGVFLMNQLCDQLRFHNNGSTVEMYFKI